MTFEIVVTGKIKTDFIKIGVEQYLKWVSPYATVKITTLPPGRGSNIEEIKKEEAKRYIGIIEVEKYAKVLILDERGKIPTSVQFASKLKTWQNRSVKKVLFLIGGPYGFSREILEGGWELFSLSKLTFTHEMAVLLLLEQLYRAETIIKGKTYHY
ncbi:50S rRNA methyltransferase [Kosmotoga arenicorallina S304]|uniref:Ribosomal RNA large subunit methyltransferase H n=1 Tax=Kosmotoga arenicorallina S304 TaxID=1453497 RepID=A0A176K215_9BACT|nr:23S rRNA (pseudouridine(1915)-N(3))-methyltransferase RlmH [Kosmotoga arenicorallina]OAA31063.1 50S rRNA methyltransferase [Kosmotoga arenicorallina S304]